MTAQVGDIYKKDNKTFSIVAMTNPIPFDPRDHGINPEFRCTACWAGYWCEYNIEGKELFLEKLFVFNSKDEYPPLNGVEVMPEEFTEFKNGTKKKDIVRISKNMGHRCYEKVHLPIDYSGKILVGDGFIDEYYIHMGYQRYWAYKKLTEFVFENGQLIACNDHSDVAKATREQFKEHKDDFLSSRDLLKFVRESFSLDYQTKAWWLNEP